jgi:hypothetical protein
MAPFWLVRLNDFLTWLNPALGGVAALLALLALLVIAVAAERFPAHAARPPVQSLRQNSAIVSAQCPREALPPEWRDLQLYD